MSPVPEVLVAYISSVVPAPLLPSDLVLDPSQPTAQGTHVKVRSVLRLHKLAMIHTTSVQRSLGKLAAVTDSEVTVKLKALLKLWPCKPIA